MSQDITTKLGYITFVKRGKYNAATSYKKPDAVSFNGGYYICKSKTAITGIDPTNTTNWDLFAAGVKNIEKTGTDSDDPFTDIYTMYNSEGNSIGTFSVKNGETGTIDDEDISENKTWSSEKLNKDYATLSSKTNVSSATLTDSADGNIAQIKMYGKARKSYNLFGSNIEQGSINGSDGADIASGSRIRTGFIPIKPNTAYSITMVTTNYRAYASYYSNASIDSYISEQGWLNVSDGRIAFTTTNTDTIKYVRFVFAHTNDAQIVPSDVSNVMLNEGTTALPYEPYGLIMAKGEVESGSKVTEWENGSISGGTLTPSMTNRIRSVDYYKIDKALKIVKSDSKFTYMVNFYNSSYSSLGNNNNWISDNEKTFTPPTDAKYIKIFGYYGSTSAEVSPSTMTNVSFFIVSSSISAYDTLGENYLLSVSDVKDELCVMADGSGQRTPKCKLVDLSTLNWTYNSSLSLWVVEDRTIKRVADYSTPFSCVCEKYDGITLNEAVGSGSTTQGITTSALAGTSYNLLVRNGSDTEKPSGLLVCELATVTPQTLTASQVQSLLALQTYKSHTDIVADCTVDLTYYKDNQNGQSVADVDSKIGLVQNEIDAFAKPIALTSLLGSGSEAVYIKIGNVVTLSGKYIKNSDSWSLFNGAPIPKYNASSASKVLGKAYSEDGTVAVDLYQAKNGTIQEHTNETRTVAVYFNITYICE